MRQALFLIGFILLVHINKAETQVSSLIYLQANKSLFVVGETFWFKGYALNAHSLESFHDDSTLYVQLMSMDVDRKTYSQEMIPLFRGFGSGNKELNSQIPPGDYYLMGFTSHSLDTSQLDFSAYRRIRILSMSSEGISLV